MKVGPIEIVKASTLVRIERKINKLQEWTETMDERIARLETAVNTIRDNVASLPPILTDIASDEAELKKQIEDLKNTQGLPPDVSAKLDEVLATAESLAGSTADVKTALTAINDAVPPVAQPPAGGQA